MYFQNPYNSLQNNPLQNNSLQRLNQYESLQNQGFNQGFQNNTMPQNQVSQSNFLKGRVVTGIDEARSAIIDFDGSVNVFLDIANGKIYTKQINLDGTASLNTYKIDNTPIVEAKNDVSNFVSKEEFNALKMKMERYSKVFEELTGGNMKNDESNANVNNV